MAVPILFEINHELTRLFAAGSRLASGDPRLKKFIGPLKKYGERVPVFLKLAENITKLLESEAAHSAKALLETKTILLSILSTQGEAPDLSGCKLCAIDHLQNSAALPETNAGYRALSPVVAALTTTGGGRLEIIKDAFEKNLFCDPRLYRGAVDALNDKYAEIADYMSETVLRSIGEPIYPFLTDGYNVRGGTADGRRLAVMNQIRGEDMLALVDEAAESGSAAVKIQAVRIMARYPKYENLLLGMLDKNKSVREEVMKALIVLDSKPGIDKMMEMYKGERAEAVTAVLANGMSGYLAEEMLKRTIDDYEAVKNCVNESNPAGEAAAKILKLKDDIYILRNKHTDDIIDFFKTALSEDYLPGADAMLPRDQKYGYNFEDIVLGALYQSGKGEDFIWEMFESSRDRLFGKIFKSKKSKSKSKLLPFYAFRIGAVRLDPDRFYDVFFKTDLYKSVFQQDHFAFHNVFLRDKNCPAFSKKIARYFVENMSGNHIDIAVEIVDPGDSGTINLIAEHLRDNFAKNNYGRVNFEILKLLGETKHKDFAELFALYCSRGHVSTSDKEYLEQFVNKYSNSTKNM